MSPTGRVDKVAMIDVRSHGERAVRAGALSCRPVEALIKVGCRCFSPDALFEIRRARDVLLLAALQLAASNVVTAAGTPQP